jgi:hypothetical protein
MTKTAKERLAEKKVYPTVSVCTPTFNRRPFIPIMLECFRNQTYPKNKIEWIIVDDGTDKIKDLVEQANIPQIKYYEVPEKMTLGAKRNYMHQYATGSIIVYMDDDDYYPPERIAHAVERLEQNKSALCAGSSEIYIYFKHIQKMIQCGPYGPKHATAGTFAFRRELLKITKYDEHAAIAEERAFLKEYTIPFVQLDPLKTILVFSHEHNTFDKRKMLDNPHPDYLKESPKTVDMFIKFKNERRVKHFFMEEVDKLLENYEPGEPKMKPDVLVQIKEIEAKREKMVQDEMAKQKANGPIILQRPGEEPMELNNAQVIDIINKQQEFIATAKSESEKQNSRVTELETLISTLQKQLIEKSKELQLYKIEIQKLGAKTEPTPLQISSSPIFTPVTEDDIVSVQPIAEKSKSDPEIFLDANTFTPVQEDNIISVEPIVEKSKSDPAILLDANTP